MERTCRQYRLHDTDLDSAFEINALCAPYEHSFHQLGPTPLHVRGGDLPAGSYRDVWEAPGHPADEADDISKDLEAVKGPLGRFEDMWSQLPGVNGSLIGRLVTPLTGNYAHIKYVADAYGKLGDAMYDIAANQRRGVLMVGPAWNGESGQAFEYHMFCWHIGTGGLGDLDKEIAKGIDQLHTDVATLVRQILNELQKLIGQALSRMLDIFNKYGGYDNLMNGRPARCLPTTYDPPHDQMEFLRYLSQAVKIAKTVLKLIDKVKHAYEQVVKKIKAWQDFKEKATNFAQDPVGAVQDLVNKKYTTVVALEKHHGWNAYAGMWRVGMLPTAA